jgi:lactoylglutathione lyase
MAITKGVNHVGLSVIHLEESKTFFMEMLGFDLLEFVSSHHAFVTDGNTMITLWQTAKKEATVETAGLHHLAFEVESANVLSEVENKLRRQNYRIQFDGIGVRGKEGGFLSLFFYDPSGIRIELVSKDKDETGDIPIIGGCGEID